MAANPNCSPVNLYYQGAECPECSEPIPDEATEGSTCEGCDHVFSENEQDEGLSLTVHVGCYFELLHNGQEFTLEEDPDTIYRKADSETYADTNGNLFPWTGNHVFPVRT